MPYELFLALRYLRSRRKRRLARVTSLVALLGIGIGVSTLIVALALATGFRDEMREKILRGTAHVNVMRADGRPISDYRNLSARIKTIPGVAGAAATSYDGAMLVGSRGVAYAMLRGLDRDSEQALNEVKDSVIEGSVAAIVEGKAEDLPSVLIGSELAARTGVRVGKIAEIISANTNSGPVNPVKRNVRVAGILRSGLFEYDSTWIYLPLDVASEFSGAPQSASVISLQLEDIYDARRVAANIRNSLGNSYTTEDWEEANRPLFNALALERRMGLFIIALIILIATLNITTTLILVVVERRRDIGILSAIGADSKSIRAIFMIEGAIIGALGALLGVFLGIVACLVGNRYQLVSLPADVYSITNVPFHPQAGDVLLAALVAFLLSWTATIYPARAAARVRPAEMLRDAD
ncbi:MAG: ABC transporter permease [Pyrinomonadaceae bacterium]|nr:ABC transporter permease [Pyrinomonadaceae bacterium]MBA3571141.1 ABC transporter permease [Pyrinomonadaceae bacterium]